MVSNIKAIEEQFAAMETSKKVVENCDHISLLSFHIIAK